MEILSKIHPVVIHFPVAIFSLYALLEIVNLFFEDTKYHKWINSFLLLGVVAGVTAVLTGNQAASNLKNISSVTENIKELIEEHETYATLTMWYFTILLAARFYLTNKKKFTKMLKVTFVILAIVGLFLIYETGEHGGKLVYDYGIGTKLFK